MTEDFSGLKLGTLWWGKLTHFYIKQKTVDRMTKTMRKNTGSALMMNEI